MKSNSISIPINYASPALNSGVNLEFSLEIISPNIIHNSEFLETFVRAREQNQKNYFNRIEPTVTNFTKYLVEGPISNPNHYLFTVRDAKYKFILCCGFKIHPNNRLEIDNVVRLSTKYPGLMQTSLESLCNWMKANFEVNCIFLRVISSNNAAIKLYQKVGFVITNSVALKIVENEKKEFVLVTCDEFESNSELKMVFMELSL